MLTSAAKIAASAIEPAKKGIISFMAVGSAKSAFESSGNFAKVAIPITTGIIAKINCTSPFNAVPILIERSSLAAKTFPIKPGEIKNEGTSITI